MIEFVGKVLAAGILTALAVAGGLYAARWVRRVAYRPAHGSGSHAEPFWPFAEDDRVGSMILADEVALSPGGLRELHHEEYGPWPAVPREWLAPPRARYDAGGWISGPCDDLGPGAGSPPPVTTATWPGVRSAPKVDSPAPAPGRRNDDVADVYDQPPAVLHVPPPHLGALATSRLSGDGVSPPLQEPPVPLAGRAGPVPGGDPGPGESHVEAWLRAAARSDGVAAWFARELEALEAAA